MGKDRTKHQDFKLIKEWISSVHSRTVIEIIQEEKMYRAELEVEK